MGRRSTEAEPSSAAGAPSAGRPDGTLRLTTLSVAVLAVIFSSIALLAFGARAGLGVAMGGAIAVANLVVFVLVVRGVLAGGPRGRIWVLVGILKIFLLFGGVWLALKSGLISPMALICGYGALPVGIALGGVIAPRVPPGDQPGGPQSPDSAPPDPDSGGA